MNLILRMEAPMMSFGGIVVDSINPTERFPARSLITGLCANALGYDRLDFEWLERLQQRLSIASRCDRKGSMICDYQTVDISRPEMQSNWTTAGKVEGRRGSDKNETHIRYRHYLADASYTVALTLAPAAASGDVSLEALLEAFDSPVRPLFLGRKCCIPSRPLLFPANTNMRLVPGSLLDALLHVPRAERTDIKQYPVRLPREFADDDRVQESREVPIVANRDWRNQLHVGSAIAIEGYITLPEGKA